MTNSAINQDTWCILRAISLFTIFQLFIFTISVSIIFNVNKYQCLLFLSQRKATPELKIVTKFSH